MGSGQRHQIWKELPGWLGGWGEDEGREEGKYWGGAGDVGQVLDPAAPEGRQRRGLMGWVVTRSGGRVLKEGGLGNSGG